MGATPLGSPLSWGLDLAKGGAGEAREGREVEAGDPWRGG